MERKGPIVINQPQAGPTAPPVQYPPSGQGEVFIVARWYLSMLVFGGVAIALFFLPELARGEYGLYFATLLIPIIMELYGVAQLNAKWTLYEDRLVYRNFLGKEVTIRKADATSFKSDMIQSLWTLKDGRRNIPIGWDVQNGERLRKVLRTWVAGSR